MKRKSLLFVSTIVALFLGGIATGSAVSSILEKPLEATYAAEGISYISRSWDGDKVVEDSSVCNDYQILYSYTTQWDDGKWYVANSDVTISSRVTISGTVNLILCDGVTLTANRGITTTGATLNIYGQSKDTGSLKAITDITTYSGIGSVGSNNSGIINIFGGTVTATGGSNSAGIGSGQNGVCDSVSIFGGTVTATGGNGAAGIGGGNIYPAKVNGGTIAIYGGKVVANGQSGAAGIGGGGRGSGKEILIYGGEITATGGIGGAGIGGGTEADSGSIKIYNGSVTATGGDQGGAGIGCGIEGSSGSIIVYNGTVTAIGGGTSGGGQRAAGIGGGYNGNTDNFEFTMYGGTVNANNDTASGKFGCGIGPGGTITINGGTLTAYGGTFCAAIGGGNSGRGGDITISGGEVHAYGGTQAAGIGNGQDGKEVNINISGGTIISQGGSRGAGIGGGYRAGGLNITVSGGTVTATGGQYAAGVGGGNDAGNATSDATAGTITINGGNVTGIAGEPGPYATNADGIGNGCGNTKETTISVGKGLNVLGSDEGIPTEGNEYTDYDNTRYQYMTIKHVHHWSYSKASEDSISVICTTGYCPTEEGLLLTLATEDFNYDGTVKTASFVPGYDVEAFPDPTINYYQNDILIDECINVGTYEARVTFGGVTATKEFNISQGTPTGYDIPTGLEATYGDDLSSVALPENWAWKTPTDKVGNAGNREHIAIYTPTNPNYKAVEETLTVAVAKADPSYTVPTGLKALINKPLSSITLPEGWSWVDPALSTGEEGLGKVFKANYIPTDPNYNSVYNIDVLVDVVTHTHNFVYTASGNVITATCDNADGNCSLPNHQATLTISAPSGSLIYDGTAKEAIYEDTSSGAAFSGIKITYINPADTSFSGVPTDAGAYTAIISFNESTLRASIQYDILKANVTYTAPTAKTGLIYTGSAQELINVGSTSDGTIQYRLEDSEYSSDVPTGINAGTYNVYYKVFGDSNHNDSEEQSLVVSIGKATVDPVGTLNSTYGKTLGDVILPSGWAWDDPISTSVGNAGSNEFNATFAEQPNYNEAHQTVTINVATADPDPVGVLYATYGDTLADVTLPAGWAWDDATQSVGNVGSHDFAAHYTAVDTNHHDKDASITVSVSQAIPTGYDIPTELNATYGDTLSSVALPSAWSWKNPNDKVGNAGSREHIAIYTPTDPNYKAVEETLTISVAKANPTYTLPTDIEIYTNETLSNVTLPSGFSWMDESIKASSLGKNTFKVRYTPVDTDNYNVVDNIDLEVNVKWEVVDPSSSSTSIVINDADEAYTTDISVKVEVKTDISVEQKRNEYASLATNNFVKSNEDIVEIYNVKLIRTTNGVEEEIQPSDIKPGTKIIVSMAIPENLVGKEFRLIHIHNAEDISEITDYSVSKDGKTLAVEVDRLSEFAFIGATDADNGFVYSTGISNILVYVFFVIFGLLLIIGVIVLIKLLKDRNNLKKESKAYSIAIAAPLALAVTYTSTIMIVLYVVAALTVIVWVTNLCLYIANKKIKHAKLDETKEVKKEETKPVEEAKPVETVKEPEPVKPVVIAKDPEPVNEEEEEETVTYTDEKGNIFNIRYIKSFTAKLIQSPDETKKYYEELKNYVLSYKKTTSRVSWHYDSINSGRNQVLKFAIRGKTLCVYYPLNTDDYEDSKYKVEAVESKKFEEVPCLYRIKNDRRLGYAKDLIDTVMSNLGLVKGEEQHEAYSNLPYESNAPLIARGLIKELKIQVNKPVEQVVSKKVNDDGDEIVTTKDAKGNIFEIRYIKSFTAKLSQASDEVKDYYNELRNYALSYKKANSRVSWHFDSINVGRNQVIKFSVRGKTLCVYYALNANDYVDTKYKVEQVESKKFEEVPCLYRIKNDRRRDYAKDLIDTVMANVPTEKGKESNEDFRIPYESTKALLAKGLIKENKVQVNKQEEQVIESHEDEEGNEVVISQDNKGNIYETRYVKSFLARLHQASDETKSYYKEIRNYILSYKGIDESISWLYDSINLNREQLLKLNIKSKALHIYLALDTSKVGKKYQVEASETKKYSKVSCSFVVTSETKLKYAKELITRIMKKHKLVLGELHQEEYDLTYLDRDALIKKGLIKEIKIKK